MSSDKDNIKVNGENQPTDYVKERYKRLDMNSIGCALESMKNYTGGATYQIAYKQKGTSKWKYTTTTKQSKVISKLKKGKRYYVKVRAYKKVGTAKYYGAWSKQKLSKKIK